MSGYTVKDTSYQVAHVFLSFVFSFLATLAVVLRLWARKIQRQGLMLNDYLIILGLMFALVETGINVYGCCFPIQWKDDVQTTPEAIRLSLQLSFVSPIVWVVAVTVIRSSIIFLYIHLFPKRLFQTFCYGVLALNMAFLVATILADCLICRPLSYRWDFTLKGGSCGDEASLSLFIAVFNLIQDAIVVVLPMPILWRLQMATGRKVALSCIFGMGIAICAVTVYRVQVTSSIGNGRSARAQADFALIALLTSLEALLGIIVACLPFLKPIVVKLSPKRSTSSKGVTDTAKSGSIPIMMHISHMLNVSSKKHFSSKSQSSMDSSWTGWYETQVTGKGQERGEQAPKAERVLGSKFVQIQVQRDVDVESGVIDV